MGNAGKSQKRRRRRRRRRTEEEEDEEEEEEEEDEEEEKKKKKEERMRASKQEMDCYQIRVLLIGAPSSFQLSLSCSFHDFTEK